MGTKIARLRLYQYIVAIMPKEMVWLAFNRLVDKVTEDQWPADIPEYELTIEEAARRWRVIMTRKGGR